MDDRTRLLIATLQEFERRLVRIAGASRVNAALELADAGLLLPTPSVSLMNVSSTMTLRLTNRGVFRSLDPIGSEGDVWFTPVQEGAVVHSWQVVHADWIDENATPGTPGTRWVKGVAFRLARDPSAPAAAGPLQLGFRTHGDLSWGLAGARVYRGDSSWPTRPLSIPLDVIGGMVRAEALPTHDTVEALTRNVLVVDVPRDAALESVLSLEVRFLDPMVVNGAVAIESNVVPVWNSRRIAYPDSQDVEQVVSDNQHRLVHPLIPLTLGPGWRAWNVRQVTSAADARRPVPVESRNGLGHAAENGGCHLAFVARRAGDARTAVSGIEDPVLAVILDPGDREIAELPRRLRVDYDATMGARGNGVPAGSEFEWIEGGPIESSVRIGGTLGLASFGGSDGFTASPSTDSDLEHYGAWWHRNRVRSVADVARAIRERYGAEFDLVDEWDLVRRSSASPLRPLDVRVRFLRPDRPARERRAVLRSGRHFLERYTRDQFHGGLRLLDVEEHVGARS